MSNSKIYFVPNLYAVILFFQVGHKIGSSGSININANVIIILIIIIQLIKCVTNYTRTELLIKDYEIACDN